MDHHHHQSQNKSISISKPNLHRLITSSNGGTPKSPPSIWFEIRLFYVRIAPCAIDATPDHLTLKHHRQELGVSLEINGSRVPASETASSTLRRDRVDRDSSEVTYVSTDNVKISGGVEFEVYEKENLLLCGSLGRFENDWSMDFYAGGSSSAFFQPKLGISSPLIEVYVAGRWSDTPVILTKMINVSPRRKSPRYSNLDAIPEVSDEIEKDHKVVVANGLIHRKLQLNETEDDYEAEGKLIHNWYPEEVYEGEDGQLTWFNAGVRVGVGIGLGMCLGLGIGVGLLMRSYQTTTRNLRRRFF
ncbi:hypothetical protein BVRB_1g004070 [Beta vulgaris subsp. vulgaris]|nr:hypothetical protein BVRB_1g004070 [Beta vulgaris subsp. vulgaris]